MDELESKAAIELGVISAIDDTHPPAPELVEHDVARTYAVPPRERLERSPGFGDGRFGRAVGLGGGLERAFALFHSVAWFRTL